MHRLSWLLMCGVFLFAFALTSAQAQTAWQQSVNTEVQQLQDARLTLLAQADAPPRSVRLPLVWDREMLDDGWALLALDFTLPQVPYGTYGLYIARLGNAYQVVLNDKLLVTRGDMLASDNSDFAKLPQYISVPSNILAANNHLTIKIRAERARHAGLSPVVVGPEVAVLPIYERDYVWRHTVPLAVVCFSLFVGGLAAALWWTDVRLSAQPWWRWDNLYLCAALSQLCWSLGQIDTLLEHPWLPWPWWGGVTSLARTLWGTFLGLFCVVLAGWTRKPLARRYWLLTWVLLAWCVGASVALYGWGSALLLRIWYVAFAAACAVSLWYFVFKAHRAPKLFQRLMLGVVGINALAGLVDVVSVRLGDSYTHTPYLPLASTLFGLMILVVMVREFQVAQAQTRALNTTLAERVAEKEQALAESYRRLERLAREQERSAERSRILRDMHDGVGAHLSAAMRQVQSEQSSREDILRSLRESMEQLKLSIDALHLQPGDVATLLANLRYRLGPRFADADLHIVWDVDPVEPLPYLDDAAMRHVQFMVYEALSNVFQHAHAHQLHISLRSVGTDVVLRIVDDGCGFEVPPDLRSGRSKGLRSLAERAQAIGASLQVQSRPGCTCIELRLQRPAWERRSQARAAAG